MATRDAVRAHLAEVARRDAAPVETSALLERMRTEAITWLNAASLQYRRLTTEAPEDATWAGWRQSVDFHFFLIAILRFRKAIDLAAQVDEITPLLSPAITSFDRELPGLKTMRNVAEHFDDYTSDKGRDRSIRRSQLQVWSLNYDPGLGPVMFRWVGVEVNATRALQAAETLYMKLKSALETGLAGERPA